MHVEVSRIFDKRIKFALKQGKAVDEYGREYTFHYVGNIHHDISVLVDGRRKEDSND